MGLDLNIQILPFIILYSLLCSANGATESGQNSSITFTGALWAKNAAGFEKLRNHPFVRELANGTLPIDKFLYFLKQDTIYLYGYGCALLEAATRTLKIETNEYEARIILSGGISALKTSAEGGTFNQLLKQRGLGARSDIRAQNAPSTGCELYTSFLLATANKESLAVFAAALLPCYRTYFELGQWMQQQQPMADQPRPYQDWINMSIKHQPDKMLQLVEKLAGEADVATQKKMEQAFARGMELEWVFWESSYRMGQWP